MPLCACRCRSDRGIAALEELLRSYPLYDPQVGRWGGLHTRVWLSAAAGNDGMLCRDAHALCLCRSLPPTSAPQAWLPGASGCQYPTTECDLHPSCMADTTSVTGPAADLPACPPPTPPLMQDEKLHDVLESIRGKFKAVVTTLGHLGDYLPKEAGADSLSF